MWAASGEVIHGRCYVVCHDFVRSGSFRALYPWRASDQEVGQNARQRRLWSRINPGCSRCLRSLLGAHEARAQLGVFGFELSKSVPQGANPLIGLPLGEAGGDVLRAIPVKGVQP